LDGGDLVGNGFWDDPSIAYLLTAAVNVPAGQTLTVGAGQVVKGREFTSAGLTVRGTLIADGTSDSRIVFTSGRDDSVGGDLRNDGQLPLGRDQWPGLHFTSTSTNSLLDNV